jgi:hypothetical protein
VLDLVVRELAPGSGLEAAQVEAGVAAAVQAGDRVADRLEHALDLVLAALVDAELDSRRAEPARAGGTGTPVVELDALLEPAERVVAGRAFDLGLVGLADLVPRVCEPVRELAVVGEQERARGVGVEAADRHDSGLGGHELDDGGPPVRVAGGGDDARGLVEEQVREALRGERASVELDGVAAPARR